MPEVYTAAESVSDPLSPLYGNYWTWEKMMATTSNHKSQQFALTFFEAQFAEVHSVSRDGLWLTLTVPISRLENVFNISCFQYDCNPGHHPTNTITLHRCTPYHVIPASLHPHVDFIGGLTDWPFFGIDATPSIRSFQKSSQVPPSHWPAGPFMNMSSIQELYSVKVVTSKLNSSAAVFEVNAPYELYNPPDLEAFQKLSALPDSPVSNFAGDKVTLGCTNYACIEPVLDVEMLMGMAPGVNFTYWTTDIANPSGNVILQWLINLASNPEPSWIHSISWGPPESHLTADLATRMDQEFAKLCTRGLTFVTSSGDDGVNYRAARGHPDQCGLSPQYPAGSSWVTTVGGSSGPEYGQPERTCQTNIPNYPTTTTSGGGFSIWYKQPGYQTNVVKSYLENMKSSLPPPSTYNPSNRAYPDLALIANNIDTITNGIFIPNGGTSASAPIFAGMLALILDARFQHALPAFGSLNPLLYHIAEQSPHAFNDLTIGDNHCTGIYGSDRNYTCCPYGFTASKGWDPVTGLGSVNFENLSSALLTKIPTENVKHKMTTRRTSST